MNVTPCRLLLFLSLAIPLGLAAAQAEPVQLDVLVVWAGEEQIYTGGIRDLLEQNGLDVSVQPLASVTEEEAGSFDVIIATGPDGTTPSANTLFVSGVPVLAYGPFGCDLLGTRKLKNGHPYT